MALSDRGRAGLVEVMGRDGVGVSQTDAGWPLAAAPPLGWSFMGRRQVCVASRNGCPRRGGGGVEHDPLVGLMLARIQSRPRPGMTIRRRWGN